MSNLIIWTFNDLINEQTLIGPLNENINLLSLELDIKVEHINNNLMVDDTIDEEKRNLIISIIDCLNNLIEEKITIETRDLIYLIECFKNSNDYKRTKDVIMNFYTNKKAIVHTFEGRKITVKTINQALYVEALQQDSIIFATGAAGSGKTYLGVAYAVGLLKKNMIKKLIITRPAVEAGEKLGFLPGDLKEKVDPYLIPIYDSLYEFLGKEQTDKLIEKGTIEIAPLAYMRGRTLDNAIIILDEAQNTTGNQMKMFITRLGFNSKMIITGDTSQIDLPNKEKSGLIEATKLLKGIKGINEIRFTLLDVMRHPLVSKIIARYEEERND